MPIPIQTQLKALPSRPGVYLFKDNEDKVIYVGKAASLYHRVRSYFSPGTNLPPKVQRLVARISDFETIVTDSEQEALILECNLIKKYRPRYNVSLKDDKTFPYLKIDLDMIGLASALLDASIKIKVDISVLLPVLVQCAKR